MSSRIYDYLVHIAEGKDINLTALLDRLQQAGISRGECSLVLRSTKLRKDRYRVEIADHDAFQRLMQRFAPSGETGRVGAAFDGDSHRAGVSGSVLMMRSIHHPHPVVALYEHGTWRMPRSIGAVGVIVENLENFLELDKTAALAADLLGRESFDIEFIYGSGNQISNRFNPACLSSFSELYCLFDIDPGGLRMFSTLLKQMPDTKIRFLAPVDVFTRLEKSRYILSAKESQEILRFVGMTPETDTLIRLTCCSL